MSHIIYRVIEYGLNRQTFMLQQMYDDVQATPDERDYIRHIIAAGQNDNNPNHIILVLNRDNGPVEAFRTAIVPAGVVDYNCHLERQAARLNAQSAKLDSTKAFPLPVAAIIISVSIGVIQTAMQI